MKPFTLSPENAHCRVLTFKEGVLSRLGHDLAFDVRTFSIEGLEDGTMRGTFRPSSLHAAGAIHDGKVSPLSTSDRESIEGTTAKEVLNVSRFPEVTFEGAIDGEKGSFTGTLTLHGVTRTISGTVTSVDGGTRAITTFVPSEFGIRPYRAMLGALRVEDRVRVEIEARDIALSDSM